MGDILNILMAMKKKAEEKKAMEERVKKEPSTGVVEEATEERVKKEPSTEVVEEAMKEGVKEEPSTGVVGEAMEEKEKEEPSTEVVGEAIEEGVKEEPSTGVVGEAIEEGVKEEPSTGVVEEAMEEGVKEEPSTEVVEEAMEEGVKEEPSTGVVEEAMEEGVKEEPSTGVVEEAGMVIIKNFIHSSTGTISMEGKWSAVNLLEETSMLNQLFLQTANRKPPSDKVVKTANQKPPSGKVTKQPTKRRVSVITTEKVEEMFSAFQEAMAVKDWDRVKYDLDNITLLINTDTGGQTEFLEMHAALVMGPSLYLLFWKLIDQFDKEYKMRHTNDKGVSTEEEDSTTTVEEVLFQALASIACFSSTFDSKDEVGVINEV